MMEIERHKISHMQKAAVDLQALAHGWIASPPGTIPEVDWSKIRTLEFQDLLKTRESWITRMESKGKTCTTCPNFDEHVSVNV